MLKRAATDSLLRSVGRSTVTAVIGPRQCGKSTLVRQLESEGAGWRYLTFDDPMALAFATDDPKGFLTEHKGPLILDEVQRCPGLMTTLKLFVDQDRRPGRYVLTGSADILALPKVNESLAGRMELIDLLPLSQAELNGTIAQNVLSLLIESSIISTKQSLDTHLLKRIVAGGFPETALRKTQEDQRAWHLSYLRTILDRDVRDIARLSGAENLPRLLALLAAKSGDFLNISSLARESKIKETTLHRYWDVLKRLFLITELPAHQTHLVDRILKSPKPFLVDTGMACSLLACDEARLGGDPWLKANLMQAFVAGELTRLASTLVPRPVVAHFRTARQLAVSFVLEFPNGDVVGIEVCPAQTVKPADGEGLKFLKEISEGHFVTGILLYEGEESLPLGSKIWALPLSALWNPTPFFEP